MDLGRPVARHLVLRPHEAVDPDPSDADAAQDASRPAGAGDLASERTGPGRSAFGRAAERR